MTDTNMLQIQGQAFAERSAGLDLLAENATAQDLRMNAIIKTEQNDELFSKEKTDFLTFWKEKSNSRESIDAHLQLLRRLVGCVMSLTHNHDTEGKSNDLKNHGVSKVGGGNLFKGFTPITNTNKLANGQSAWQSRDLAIRNLSWALKSTAAGKESLSQFKITKEYADSLMSELEKAKASL